MNTPYSFTYDHRSTQRLNKRLGIEWFKCKLGLKFGENIQKLADAPGFWHTASPQVGSGRGSKPSKQSGGLNTIVSNG